MKIVLVSADADERDVALLMQLGVSYYLPKTRALQQELVKAVSALRALRQQRADSRFG